MKDHPCSIEFRPIVITKATIDRIKKECAKPMPVIGLYVFYYYTAIWQCTNQPRCTISYAAKAMKVGSHVIRRAKGELIRLGLIQDIQGRKDDGTMGVCFLQVRHYTALPKNRTAVKPDSGKLCVNSYSTSKGNAYSTVIRGAEKSRHAQSAGLFNLETPWSAKMARRMERFLVVKNMLKRKVHIASWQAAFTRLITEGGETRKNVREVFDWWKDNVIKNKYCPVVYSATGFCKEFARIEKAMERDIKERSGEDEIDDEETIYDEDQWTNPEDEE